MEDRDQNRGVIWNNYDRSGVHSLGHIVRSAQAKWARNPASRQYDMQEHSAVDTDRAISIVLEGLRHAADRFGDFPELQEKLAHASLIPDAQTASGIRVILPGADHPYGAILFDPDHILQLSREHRHPEWVVCARIERLILIEGEGWESDDTERERLVAHRERRRARRESIRSRAL